MSLKQTAIFAAGAAFGCAMQSLMKAPKKKAGPLPEEKSGGLLEYSVVYTDRACNSMSTVFQGVMKDLHRILTKVYSAKRLVIVPGSGTYAMEAVARQFATNKKVLVVRNGYFSYRWTDVFEQGKIMEESIVMLGRAVEEKKNPHFAPPCNRGGC